MTDKVTETVTIAAEDVGLRLDRVLATHIATLSRSHLKTLILAPARSPIAARTIRDPAATVKSGEHNYGDRAAARTSPTEGRNDPAQYHLRRRCDRRHRTSRRALSSTRLPVMPPGTLVNALIAHCGASLSGIGGIKRPGIVHRLDKDTTGLMVVAKNRQRPPLSVKAIC